MNLYFKVVHIVWIKRDITETLKKRAKTRPCVLLTGARQTGKSALLEKTFPKYSYVSLDWPQKAGEAQNSGAYFLEKHLPPIIIDEIQYAPQLFPFLKLTIDKRRQSFGRYLLSGSQKYSLMKGVTESLSGRISILECHSLSIRELYLHTGIPLSTKQILKWMVQGGYPEVHSQKLKNERFYADYIASYLERDVRQLIQVKDLSLFNKFLRLLAFRSGQVLSMHSLALDTGVSVHTIKSWLSILEANNIIYLLRPFYNNYGKRLIKSPKLYFLDTGILCFLAGLYNVKSLENSALLGSFFETLCLGQLIRHLNRKDLPQNIYYFRDNHGNEVDFLLPEGDQLQIYECKWRWDHDQMPRNLVKFQSLIGKHHIKKIKIITSAKGEVAIDKNCRITNLIDL